MGKLRAQHPLTWLTSLVRPMSFISDKKIQLMSTARVHQKIQENTFTELISGFHRALLQSITYISRLNTLDYTKLRS